MSTFSFVINGYYGDSPLEGGGYAGYETLMNREADSGDHQAIIQYARDMATYFADRVERWSQIDYEFSKARMYSQILEAIFVAFGKDDEFSSLYRYDYTTDTAYVYEFRVFQDSYDLSTR